MNTDIQSVQVAYCVGAVEISKRTFAAVDLLPWVKRILLSLDLISL